MRTRSRNGHVHPCWAARLLVLGVVVAAAVGCTSTSGAGGDRTVPSKAPSSASVRTISSAAGPPALPVEATKPTREGAAAFVHHFLNRLNSAFRTSSPGSLNGLTLSSCTFCADVTKDLSAAQKAGERFIGGVISVKTVVAAPGDPTAGMLVNVVVDETPGRRISSTGKTVLNYPSQVNLRMDIGVRWMRGKWFVIEVSIPG